MSEDYNPHNVSKQIRLLTEVMVISTVLRTVPKLPKKFRGAHLKRLGDILRELQGDDFILDDL